MEANTFNLEEVYNQQLSEMLTAEKKYNKYFERLAKAAYTEELRSGLSPASNEFPQHLERIKQCMAIQKIKASTTTTELNEVILKQVDQAIKSGKEKTIKRDIQLLQVSKIMLQVKIAVYQTIHQIAVALGNEIAAVMMEECYKDNQNAYAYLMQISANIIYPQSVVTS